MYRAIKTLYDHGKITKEKVAEYVTKRLITAAQYKAITGEEYISQNHIDVLSNA